MFEDAWRQSVFEPFEQPTPTVAVPRGMQSRAPFLHKMSVHDAQTVRPSHTMSVLDNVVHQLVHDVVHRHPPRGFWI